MAGNGKPAGNIKLGISLDGTEFGNTLDEINAKVKQAESVMKANMKAYDAAGRTYEGLSQRTQDLTKVMDGQSAKIQELERRRRDAIDTYGAESKQATNLATQINNATAKYNAYEKQLNNTRKELAYSQTSVNDLTKEMKENEKATNDEVRALKQAGDSAGAYEAQQKGLTRQVELSERAVREQQKVVKLLASEFGDSARETQDARSELNKLERQSKLSNSQLDGLRNAADDAGREIDDLGDNSERSGRKLDGFKDKMGSLKNSMAFGAAAGVASNVIGRVIDGVMDLKDEAFEASDSLDKFTQTMQFAGIDNNKIKESQKVMKDYADQTVYELGDVMNTTAQLAANGVEDFNGLTQAIGNVNAVSGGNAETFKSVATAMTQTIGTGKLTTENFNQISDAIPGASGKIQAALKEMGAYTSGDFRAAMEEGEISAEELTKAFMNLGMTDVAKKASSSTKTIEGAVGNLQASVVNMINEIIGALGKGNITTFIDGITSGVDNLTKMIKPGAQAAVDAIKPLQDAFKDLLGLFSNDATAQTKGLDFIRNLLPPAMAQEVINNVSRIKQVIGGIWDGLSNNDSSFIYKMGLQPETVAQIESTINAIKEYISGVGINLKNLFAASTEIMKGLFDTLGPYVMPIIEKIAGSLGQWGQSITKFWNENGKQIIEAIKNFFTFIQPVVSVVMQLFMGFIDNVIGLVNGLLNSIQGAIKIFTGIFTGDFAKMWEGVKQLFFGAVELIWNLIQIMFFKRLLDGARGLVTGFKTAVQNLWTSARSVFQSGIDDIGIAMGKWVNSLLSGANNLRTSFTGMVQNLWNSIKSFFDDGIRNSLQGIQNWISNIGTHITNLRNSMIERISSLWNTVKSAFDDGIQNVLGKMQALPGKIADGIRAGAGAVKSAFESIFKSAMDAVKKPINLIIDGASWVLEKLGGEKIKAWSPNYAKGTDGHPGGFMTVNDGAGAEMVIRPNGQAFIPVGQNVTMYGEPGTHVIPARDTATLMGKQRSTFAYAKGTDGGFFSNLWSGAKNIGSNILDSVKDAIGDVMDYIDDPSKLVGKLLGSDLLSGLTHYPLDIGKGILTKAKDALTKKVTEMFESFNLGGDLDTGISNMKGVYQYLADIALKVMEKFPGMTVTSGYRPGDPYSHGSRNAIDIAYGSGMNGSSQYFAPANYAFDHFKSQVGYVITQGKVRDRAGTSGTGIHNDWRQWPDNDHYDHLHINGVPNPTQRSVFTGNVGGSWAEKIRKAAAMMGQTINESQVQGLLAQIQRESSGNEKIIQSSAVWDVNTASGNPAKGLLQYIPQTFNSYKIRGYEDIFNGFHQLLAFFNNSNWRNDLMYGRSGWGPRGRRIRPYSNGGIVNQHQIAEIAEGNKPEIIIPLDGAKRSRAMQLLAIAMDKLGVSNSLGSSANVSVTDTSKIEQKLDTLINIMSQFSSDLKNLTLEADGRNLATVVGNEQAKTALIQSKIRGEG